MKYHRCPDCKYQDYSFRFPVDDRTGRSRCPKCGKTRAQPLPQGGWSVSSPLPMVNRELWSAP